MPMLSQVDVRRPSGALREGPDGGLSKRRRPMYEVVVVGAGPGGSTAAKRCAEHGLRTLVLEKKRLPRDKVCSGLLLGRLARNLITEEFGPVPEEIVLRRMHGLILWMPGIGQRKIAQDTPIAWRKDLDYWM